MKNCKQVFILLTFFLICNNSFSQKIGTNDTIKVPAVIIDGDTIPSQHLEPVELISLRVLTAAQKQQRLEWTRLINATYITYPYAKASGKIMNEINAKLVGVADKKERKKIIKSREKELRKEFGDKITNLSIYQGKVMMKLIYRETGNSCYEIIEEFKGGFTAFIYQTVAKIAGTNLKQTYNANGEDKEMEKVVQQVERMYGYRR